MRGLLADVNVQGHLPYLRRMLEFNQLWDILADLKVSLATFRTLGLSPKIDDRSLWQLCQQDEWVLFTENRNLEDEDSLEATLVDSWQPGQLPVLTLASKPRFERSPEYASQVAVDIAELLFGIVQGEYRDRPRIYVPLTSPPQTSHTSH